VSAATATGTAGTLVGPAGGTWEKGTAERAQCALRGSWVTAAPIWKYWLGLVCKATVCANCAEGSTT
jgi:hypothetical protein